MNEKAARLFKLGVEIDNTLILQVLHELLWLCDSDFGPFLSKYNGACLSLCFHRKWFGSMVLHDFIVGIVRKELILSFHELFCDKALFLCHLL